MRGLKATGIFLLGVGFASVAQACSCYPTPPPLEAIKGASAVFLAEIKEIADSESIGAGGLNKKVTCEVKKIWKGVGKKTIEISTEANTASCGFEFSKGQTYLIYANGPDQDHLSVSLCSRTHVFMPVNDDNDLFGEGNTPPAA